MKNFCELYILLIPNFYLIFNNIPNKMSKSSGPISKSSFLFLFFVHDNYCCLFFVFTGRWFFLYIMAKKIGICFRTFLLNFFEEQIIAACLKEGVVFVKLLWST
jgi:hypothetical protein